MKKYFETDELTREQVAEALSAEAYDVRNTEYFRPLTKEEMEDTESEYITVGKKVLSIEDEIRRLTEHLKEDLKEYKKREKELKRIVSDGGEQTSGPIYYMIDRQNSELIKVDLDCFIIGTQPMTAKERQLFIGEASQITLNRKQS